MKVAQVVCTFPPYKGGIGNSAYRFAEVLVKQGHEVTVFTPNYTSPLTPLLNRRGKLSLNRKLSEVKVVRLKPFLKYGNGAFLPQLLFRLHNFDIVHLHYPFFGGVEAIWLAKLLAGKKFKLIIHYHMDIDGLSLAAKFLSWPSRLIRNSLFKQADAITCASLDYIKNSEIKNIYRKYKDKFFEISFGVDIKKFQLALAPGISLIRSSRERGVNKNILFVGGLDQAHYFKGVNVLLDAVAKLRIKNWQLDIVGEGNLRSQYKKQAEKLGVAEKIKFANNVDNEQLVKYYQNADVLVLPSINKNEAFGLVLLEAMACGTPVITSNLPGVRSVFQDGIQGLLAEPKNAYDLRDKIERILSDNEKRKQMGLAGRKLVEDEYSWERAGKKLNYLYRLVY